MQNKRLRLFLVCSGLGHINRGYESFTEELYTCIKDEESLDLWLFKGKGLKSKKSIPLPCMRRESKTSKWLAKLIRYDAYHLEQLSFFTLLIPYLLIQKPKVILYSDFILGTYLFHFKKWMGLKYQLLLSNGAPNGPPYKTEDHVQQLLQYHYNNAIAKGESSEKQTVIPYGIDSAKHWNELTIEKKNEIKTSFGLPLDKKIILSVGAVNKDQKRMDYLVTECSNLDPTKFHVLMVGQISDGTKEIQDLANVVLSQKNFTILQLEKKDMHKVYFIADTFILASLREGLPRVLLEALNAGLPIGVHDYPLVREILGEHGYFADFTQNGNLYTLLVTIFNTTEHDKSRVHEFCYQTYSWEMLKPRYLDMIYKVATHG